MWSLGWGKSSEVETLNLSDAFAVCDCLWTLCMMRWLVMQVCLGVLSGNEAVPPEPSNSGGDIQPVTSPASAEEGLQNFQGRESPGYSLFHLHRDSCGYIMLIQNQSVAPLCRWQWRAHRTQCWAAKPSLLSSQFSHRHAWDQGKWG